MKAKNLFINLRLGLVLLVFLFGQQSALAKDWTGREKVVESFLNTLKAQVLTDLNERADRVANVLDCFEDSTCQEAEDILEKYQEFRVYFALLNYKDISYRIKQMSQGYAVSSGVKMFYTTRTKQGRQEWKIIEDIAENDKAEILIKLVSLSLNPETRNGYKLREDFNRAKKSFYSSTVSEFLVNYPYFGVVGKQASGFETMAKALVKTGREFELSISNVENLKGDERFELVGFTSSVEKAVESLNPRESELITNFMAAKNNDTRFWGKVLKIITNVRTLALATCHVGTYALAGVPHPVVQIARLGAGFACSSYGIFITVKLWGEATGDILRQLQYANTRVYDQEVLNQYFKSYLVTSVMAYLYVIPSLPGLKGRAVGIRDQSQLLARAVRLNKMSVNPKRLLIFNRSNFLKDVKGLARSYGQYYGEELAINTLVSAGGQYLSSLVALEAALISGMNQAFQRPIQVMTYGDLLKSL